MASWIDGIATSLNLKHERISPRSLLSASKALQQRKVGVDFSLLGCDQSFKTLDGVSSIGQLSHQTSASRRKEKDRVSSTAQSEELCLPIVPGTETNGHSGKKTSIADGIDCSGSAGKGIIPDQEPTDIEHAPVSLETSLAEFEPGLTSFTKECDSKIHTSTTKDGLSAPETFDECRQGLEFTLDEYTSIHGTDDQRATVVEKSVSDNGQRTSTLRSQSSLRTRGRQGMRANPRRTDSLKTGKGTYDGTIGQKEPNIENMNENGRVNSQRSRPSSRTRSESNELLEAISSSQMKASLNQFKPSNEIEETIDQKQVIDTSNPEIKSSRRRSRSSSRTRGGRNEFLESLNTPRMRPSPNVLQAQTSHELEVHDREKLTINEKAPHIDQKPLIDTSNQEIKSSRRRSRSSSRTRGGRNELLESMNTPRMRPSPNVLQAQTSHELEVHDREKLTINEKAPHKTIRRFRSVSQSKRTDVFAEYAKEQNTTIVENCVKEEKEAEEKTSTQSSSESINNANIPADGQLSEHFNIFGSTDRNKGVGSASARLTRMRSRLPSNADRGELLGESERKVEDHPTDELEATMSRTQVPRRQRGRSVSCRDSLPPVSPEQGNVGKHCSVENQNRRSSSATRHCRRSTTLQAESFSSACIRTEPFLPEVERSGCDKSVLKQEVVEGGELESNLSFSLSDMVSGKSECATHPVGLSSKTLSTTVSAAKPSSLCIAMGKARKPVTTMPLNEVGRKVTYKESANITYLADSYDEVSINLDSVYESGSSLASVTTGSTARDTPKRTNGESDDNSARSRQTDITDCTDTSDLTMDDLRDEASVMCESACHALDRNIGNFRRTRTFKFLLKLGQKGSRETAKALKAVQGIRLSEIESSISKSYNDFLDWLEKDIVDDGAVSKVDRDHRPRGMSKSKFRESKKLVSISEE